MKDLNYFSGNEHNEDDLRCKGYCIDRNSTEVCNNPNCKNKLFLERKKQEEQRRKWELREKSLADLLRAERDFY